jgi:deoxyribodipyrimidine photo-lyase
VTDDSALLWFRRDLRTGDHPALLAAAGRARQVLGVFVLDEALLAVSGAPRRAFMYGALRALDRQLDGRLLVVRGEPAEVLPAVARAAGAVSVHVTGDTAPYGNGRDERVRAALADRSVEFVRTGSPYAITPGRVRKHDGQPFRVFTPFHRAWVEHGWPAPAGAEAEVRWQDPATLTDGPSPAPIPDEEPGPGMRLPEPGERAGLAAWTEFLDDRLADYQQARDRPDLDATSRLSPYLRWGCLHPRTLLADLAAAAEQHPAGVETFRTELAWREFHADVLWHRPQTARHNYDSRFDRMTHDTGPAADEAFRAWCAGRTGYPLVDAGMRQLLAEGWMHNRVRMVVASFLVKDLHLPWWRGARHFMRHLVDGDLASNQLNWQWTAGSGTDAAPYFRIFNPTTQGEKFDPTGDYVRRYVPELRELAGKSVHQPWKRPGGPPDGYPHPLVEHAQERRVALDRYAAVTSGD